MSIQEPTSFVPRPKKAADSGRVAGEDRGWTPGREAALDAATPSKTFRLPGGKTLTVATDRVRAAPAVTPQVSFMLGQNAIGLGLWGLLAPKGVNRFLGLKSSPQVTQALFGAREMATGMALFSDPTKASVLWARVAGDLFDIVLLRSLNRRDNPKRANARLALGVVLAVTALDVVAAVRMSSVKRNCEGARP
ncbi:MULTISPECIES: hypothetical protein [Caulobacter]|uniref:Uncharacterized protein n=2 Tax=Caulobacter rhizosphaerae TaxID=2010972 RepID=A0ABU1MUP2_9CAUL|nr:MULTISPECIES: hypothetical protein [Caulobacter]MDR6529545.1 hypothetical protein [Caulobacter rhizosphaerae]